VFATYVVQGHTSDGGVGELGDVSHGTADTAAAVQHLVAGGHTEAASNVVLVTSDGLLEGLAGQLVSEVEALAPAPLVEKGGQLVVGVHQGGVRLVTVLQTDLLVIVQVVILINPIVHLDLALLLLGRESGQNLPGSAQRVSSVKRVNHQGSNSEGSTCKK